MGERCVFESPRIIHVPRYLVQFFKREKKKKKPSHQTTKALPHQPIVYSLTP